jgi:hypothetical protein
LLEITSGAAQGRMLLISTTAANTCLPCATCRPHCLLPLHCR